MLACGTERIFNSKFFEIILQLIFLLSQDNVWAKLILFHLLLTFVQEIHLINCFHARSWHFCASNRNNQSNTNTCLQFVKRHTTTIIDSNVAREKLRALTDHSFLSQTNQFFEKSFHKWWVLHKTFNRCIHQCCNYNQSDFLITKRCMVSITQQIVWLILYGLLHTSGKKTLLISWDSFLAWGPFVKEDSHNKFLLPS